MGPSSACFPARHLCVNNTCSINKAWHCGEVFARQFSHDSKTDHSQRVHRRVNKRFLTAPTMMAATELLQSTTETSPAPAAKEGKRATALRTVLTRSVEKTIQTCSSVPPKPPLQHRTFQESNVEGRYDKVAQSFPTIAEKAPDQLKFALDQSLAFLKSQILVLLLWR